MKKLGKIKLNQLSKADLKKKEMNLVKGGQCACIGVCNLCSCAYAGEQCPEGDHYWGGASIMQNAYGNSLEGTSDVNSNTV